MVQAGFAVDNSPQFQTDINYPNLIILNNPLLKDDFNVNIDIEIKQREQQNQTKIQALEQKKLEEKAKEIYSLGQLGLQLVQYNGINLDNKNAIECTCPDGINCKNKGKHPYFKEEIVGFSEIDRKSLDIQQLYIMLMMDPYKNWAARTGLDSGILVINIDNNLAKNKTYEIIRKEMGAGKDTLEVITGGGGISLFFKVTKVLKDIDSFSDLLPNTNILFNGCAALLPPSIHESGREYIWKNKTTEIIDFPESLYLYFLKLNNEKRKNRSSSIFSQRKTIIQYDNFNVFLNNSSKIEGLFQSVARYMAENDAKEEEILFAIKQLSSGFEKSSNFSIDYTNAKKISSVAIEKAGKKIFKWVDSPEELIKTPNQPHMTEDMLPPILTNWIKYASASTESCIDVVASSLIIVLGSIIGRKACIYPRADNNEYILAANLWGVVVGLPGFRKTPPIEMAFQAIEHLEHLLNSENDSEERDYQASAEMVTAILEDVVKNELKRMIKNLNSCTNVSEQEKIKAHERAIEKFVTEHSSILKNQKFLKQYRTTDVTIQKIHVILAKNPQGILLFRDELSGWFKEMEGPNRLGEREYYLQTWNGNSSYKMDRIGRGMVKADALCLSIIGTIQPAKLAPHLSYAKNQGGDGLLQRFQLITMARSYNGEIEDLFDLKNKSACVQAIKSMYAIAEKLDKIPLPEKRDGKFIRNENALRFNIEGQLMMDKWLKDLRTRSNDNDLQENFRAFLCKFECVAPKLSLIFSLIDKKEYLDDKGNINVACANLAIKWSNYFEKSAALLYNAYAPVGLTAAEALLNKIKSGDIKDCMRIRDISRKEWSGLREKSSLEKGIMLLEEKGHVKKEIQNDMGNQSFVLRLHPTYR